MDRKIRMPGIIVKRRDELKKLCRELHIKRLYAFGSVMTDKFNEKSDLDFLISFLDDISIEDYTNNYFEFHYKLKELFDREIDLVTERTLSNPYFIESVNETKELLYEA